MLQVSASVTLKPQLMVTLHDIQNLVLWVLGQGENPKWIFVKARDVCLAHEMLCYTCVSAEHNACPLQNKPLVRKVVLIALPGISHSLFDKEHVRGPAPLLASLRPDH